MADPSTRELAIFLPSSLVDTGQSSVLRLGILDDTAINGGKRALTRSFRDANASDPGRIKRVQWEVWGPIGSSLESTSGSLKTDFCQNLETRWERRLISSGAQTSVTLTGDDPAGPAAYFGTAYFGTSYFSSGGTIGGQDVIVFDEQGGYLFAHRGQLSTQINMDTWTVVQSVDQQANIRDAALWRSMGRVAMGPTVPMRTRTGVSSTGSTYADTTSTSPAGDVYASAVKRGSDRAWYIDADENNSSFNYAGYSLDAFATLASPFQVGDPDVGTTGIGPFGPFTMFGAEDNLYSFTDQGKPVPLSRALLNHFTDHNGQQWADPGFGWNYAITSIGLRAVQPGIDNPVGVGERMRGFTGHNGVPHAIWAERGELWVVYETTGGALYGYRGVFGPETAATGQPLFFPWFYQASGTCNALFSSVSPAADPIQNFYMFRANGTNMTYMVAASNGRDDLDTSYVYSTSGGTWYGTTLDRDTNLLKVLRLARFRTRNLTSGSSWQLAMAFDPNPVAPLSASYVNIGAAVTSNGAQTITPISASVPTASISGRTLKPRLTQVAGGSGASTSPPEIDGVLEIEYDERPEQIEEITAVVNMTATGYSNNRIYDLLQSLVGQQTNTPVQIQLPDDLVPAVSTSSGGGYKYAMIASVTRRDDIKDPSIEGIEVRFQVWPQASAV